MSFLRSTARQACHAWIGMRYVKESHFRLVHTEYTARSQAPCTESWVYRSASVCYHRESVPGDPGLLPWGCCPPCATTVHLAQWLDDCAKVVLVGQVNIARSHSIVAWTLSRRYSFRRSRWTGCIVACACACGVQGVVTAKCQLAALGSADIVLNVVGYYPRPDP